MAKKQVPAKAAVPQKRVIRLLEIHPELRKYESDFELRMQRYDDKLQQLTQGKETLCDFANAHKYYGFHRTDNGFVYREWAPGADRLYLTGDFNGWHWTDNPMTREENGNWSIVLPEEVLHPGSKVMTIVQNGDNLSQHIPLFAHRVTEDWHTHSWCCEVLDESIPFEWTDRDFRSTEKPLIYEAHVGMASEDYRIATYREFADNILPYIKKSGYNTVQLMAIMEHPYYASFGYQVSSFFAASSRYGRPEELKYLVNKAHELGIRVLLDVVHSHASTNTLEGINRFDGTDYQFFHAGGKGDHPAWGTKCFNYDKPEVLHFLLSNLKYWMEEYHFDGFRFDGVTSMLYQDHGLGVAFDHLDKYFTMNTDVEAVTYLQLATQLVHQVNPDALLISEDMSGMPGMCEKVEDGGIGFDYRLGMGIPDMWIRLARDKKDEDWNLNDIWTELTFRNAPTVAYVESHDQALVGDKTMIFRFADAAMYTQMEKSCHTDVIDRAIALHKMLRLLTLTAGGTGYLNFMGNEFGHPEWIDFPNERNHDSFLYCRRQWSLLYNNDLKYEYLYHFDHDMLFTAKHYRIFDQEWPTLDKIHNDDHVLAFERGSLLFVFNFSPNRAYTDYVIPVQSGVDYQVLFSSDDYCYGGYGRIARNSVSAYTPGLQGNNVRLYLPPRTCTVLAPVQPEPVMIKEEREEQK